MADPGPQFQPLDVLVKQVDGILGDQQADDATKKEAIDGLLKQHGYTQETWRHTRDLLADSEQHKRGMWGLLPDTWRDSAEKMHTVYRDRAQGIGPLESLGNKAKNLVRTTTDLATFGLWDQVVGRTKAQFGDKSSVDAIAEERKKTEEAGAEQTFPEKAVSMVVGGTGVPAIMAERGASLVGKSIREGWGAVPRIAALGGEGAAYGTVSGVGHETGTKDPIVDEAMRVLKDTTLGGASALAFGSPSLMPSRGLPPFSITQGTSPAVRQNPGQELTPSQRIVLGHGQADADAARRVADPNLPATAAPPTPQDTAAFIRQRVQQGGPQTTAGDVGPAMQGLSDATVVGPLTPERSLLINRLRQRGAGDPEVPGQVVTTGRDARVRQAVEAETPSGIGNAREAIEHFQTQRDLVHNNEFPRVLNNQPNVPRTEVEAIVNRLDQARRQLDPDGPEYRTLTGIRDRLVRTDDQGNTFWTTNPLTLGKLKVELSGRVSHGQQPTSGAQAQVEGANRLATGLIDRTLDTHVPGYAEVNAKSRSLAQMQEQVNLGERALVNPTPGAENQGRVVTQAELDAAMQGGTQVPIGPLPPGVHGPVPGGPVRIGMGSDLQARIGTNRGNLGAVDAAIDPSNPVTFNKAQQVLGGDSVRRLREQVVNENTQAAAEGALVNSKTSQREGSKASLEASAVGVPYPSIKAVTRDLVQALLSSQSNRRSESIMREIGRVTGLQGQQLEDYANQLVRAFQATQTKARAAPVLSNTAGSVGGDAIGGLLSP